MIDYGMLNGENVKNVFKVGWFKWINLLMKN